MDTPLKRIQQNIWRKDKYPNGINTETMGLSKLSCNPKYSFSLESAVIYNTYIHDNQQRWERPTDANVFSVLELLDLPPMIPSPKTFRRQEEYPNGISYETFGQTKTWKQGDFPPQ